MEYFIEKKVDYSFEIAVEKTISALKAEGFGIVSDLNMKTTFKDKIGKEFRNYRIFGACNPNFAFQAIETVDKVGLLLPCNVVVQELKDGTVEVMTINPVELMHILKNDELQFFALEIKELLRRAINTI